MGRAGIPDIIGCFRGRFLGIECKAGKGKTTALQDLELEKIRQAKGFAYVVNETNLQDLKELLIWMR
jgi:Holliday junction resolvase